jgi:hypothetical protein
MLFKAAAIKQTEKRVTVLSMNGYFSCLNLNFSLRENSVAVLSTI